MSTTGPDDGTPTHPRKPRTDTLVPDTTTEAGNLTTVVYRFSNLKRSGDSRTLHLDRGCRYIKKVDRTPESVPLTAYPPAHRNWCSECSSPADRAGVHLYDPRFGDDGGRRP